MKDGIQLSRFEVELDLSFSASADSSPEGSWEQDVTYQLATSKAESMIETSDPVLDHTVRGVRFVLTRAEERFILLAYSFESWRAVALSEEKALRIQSLREQEFDVVRQMTALSAV